MVKSFPLKQSKVHSMRDWARICCLNWVGFTHRRRDHALAVDQALASQSTNSPTQNFVAALLISSCHALNRAYNVSRLPYPQECSNGWFTLASRVNLVWASACGSVAIGQSLWGSVSVGERNPCAHCKNAVRLITIIISLLINAMVYAYH